MVIIMIWRNDIVIRYDFILHYFNIKVNTRARNWFGNWPRLNLIRISIDIHCWVFMNSPTFTWRRLLDFHFNTIIFFITYHSQEAIRANDKNSFDRFQRFPLDLNTFLSYPIQVFVCHALFMKIQMSYTNIMTFRCCEPVQSPSVVVDM